MMSTPNESHGDEDSSAQADEAQATPQSNAKADAYWSKSLTVVVVILGIWALISLGCGILLREFLDSAMPNIGGAPFGFWMAQQGSIIGFLTLLVVYMLWMNRLDSQHGYDVGND